MAPSLGVKWQLEAEARDVGADHQRTETAEKHKADPRRGPAALPAPGPRPPAEPLPEPAAASRAATTTTTAPVRPPDTAAPGGPARRQRPGRRAGRCRRPAQRSRGRPGGARRGAGRAGPGPAPPGGGPERREEGRDGRKKGARGLPAAPVQAPRRAAAAASPTHNSLISTIFPSQARTAHARAAPPAPRCTARFRGRPRPHGLARPIPPRRASPRPLLTRAHAGTPRLRRPPPIRGRAAPASAPPHP